MARWNLPPDTAEVLLLLSLAFVDAARRCKTVYQRLLPWQIEEFGGEYVHQGVLNGTPPIEAVPRQVFPGRALSGFAHHDAVLLLRSRRDRWAVWGRAYCGLGYMGFYQMLRGQHFLSHTLFTMIGA